MSICSFYWSQNQPSLVRLLIPDCRRLLRWSQCLSHFVNHFGEDDRSCEDQYRSDPVVDRERIAKVHDREQQRDELSQRYDQRHG